MGTMIKCRNCGKSISDEYLFCPYCASQLESICPGCNKKVLPEYAFCPYCATEIRQNKPKAVKPAKNAKPLSRPTTAKVKEPTPKPATKPSQDLNVVEKAKTITREILKELKGMKNAKRKKFRELCQEYYDKDYEYSDNNDLNSNMTVEFIQHETYRGFNSSGWRCDFDGTEFVVAVKSASDGKHYFAITGLSFSGGNLIYEVSEIDTNNVFDHNRYSYENCTIFELLELIDKYEKPSILEALEAIKRYVDFRIIKCLSDVSRQFFDLYHEELYEYGLRRKYNR